MVSHRVYEISGGWEHRCYPSYSPIGQSARQTEAAAAFNNTLNIFEHWAVVWRGSKEAQQRNKSFEPVSFPFSGLADLCSTIIIYCVCVVAPH